MVQQRTNILGYGNHAHITTLPMPYLQLMFGTSLLNIYLFYKMRLNNFKFIFQDF